MVIIDYERKQAGCGKYHRISVTGHADYAEHGKDIVCSAASILCYTLIAILDRYKYDEKEVYLDNGDIKIMVVDTSPRDEATVIFDTILQGFELLAEQYPENIFFKGCRI